MIGAKPFGGGFLSNFQGPTGADAAYFIMSIAAVPWHARDFFGLANPFFGRGIFFSLAFGRDFCRFFRGALTFLLFPYGPITRVFLKLSKEFCYLKLLHLGAA